MVLLAYELGYTTRPQLAIGKKTRVPDDFPRPVNVSNLDLLRVADRKENVRSCPAGHQIVLTI
jgi:hypothetical protein